jgi:hypothetical protein
MSITRAASLASYSSSSCNPNVTRQASQEQHCSFFKSELVVALTSTIKQIAPFAAVFVQIGVKECCSFTGLGQLYRR